MANISKFYNSTYFMFDWIWIILHIYTIYKYVLRKITIVSYAIRMHNRLFNFTREEDFWCHYKIKTYIVLYIQLVLFKITISKKSSWYIVQNVTNHVGKVQRLFGTVELYESVATWNSHFRKSSFFLKRPKTESFFKRE